ncbi:MAG: hypothetical protein WDN69_02410 [Aliidongia sp.]
MPGDVDIALKQELEKTKQFAKVQREYRPLRVAGLSCGQLAGQ